MYVYKCAIRANNTPGKEQVMFLYMHMYMCVIFISVGKIWKVGGARDIIPREIFNHIHAHFVQKYVHFRINEIIVIGRQVGKRVLGLRTSGKS